VTFAAQSFRKLSNEGYILIILKERRHFSRPKDAIIQRYSRYVGDVSYIEKLLIFLILHTSVALGIRGSPFDKIMMDKHYRANSGLTLVVKEGS
jgi:hypothetical protein